jgi:hypothetical protein
MRAHTAVGIAVLGVAVLALTSAARAVNVQVDYDALPPGDFRTAPYFEGGVLTTVNCGHYEASADGTGTTEGDKAFNLDERAGGHVCGGPCPTCSKVTITAQGFMFDALSVDVINPAETSSEYTITAIGGGGGTWAPTTTGQHTFGPQFSGITALVITQNSPGALMLDDLEIQSLPEPSAFASLLVSGLAVSALRSRRIV